MTLDPYWPLLFKRSVNRFIILFDCWCSDKQGRTAMTLSVMIDFAARGKQMKVGHVKLRKIGHFPGADQ